MSDYYVGLDVHKASICIAVLNAAGKLVMESVVETGATTVLDFLKGLRGQVEIAAITLAVWKAGAAFNPGQVSGPAA